MVSVGSMAFIIKILSINRQSLPVLVKKWLNQEGKNKSKSKRLALTFFLFNAYSLIFYAYSHRFYPKLSIHISPHKLLGCNLIKNNDPTFLNFIRPNLIQKHRDYPSNLNWILVQEYRSYLLKLNTV